MYLVALFSFFFPIRSTCVRTFHMMDLFTCFTTILNIGVCTEKLIVGFHEDSVMKILYTE